MPDPTVQRRLRLRRLIPALRRAFDRGETTATVAEAAARLSADQQAALERALLEGTRLTVRAVQKLTREHARAAAGELPNGLFVDREADWRVTVIGHLRAALEAVPGGDHHSALARAIADVLGQAKDT
jgi:hypothetical protein